MASQFDAYHQWLGISPKDQPPNHYRLLGVDLFEADPNVISNAADQRMAHVRSFQTGQRAAESQEILNEIAAARICLLNPEKKAKYDEYLRSQEAEAQAGATAGIEDDLAQLLGAEQPAPSSGTRSLPRSPARTRRSTLSRTIGAGACILLTAVIFTALRGRQASAPPEPSATRCDRSPEPSTASPTVTLRSGPASQVPTRSAGWGSRSTR